MTTSSVFPTVKNMKPLSKISKGRLISYRYRRMPQHKYSNIALIDDNGDVYLQRHLISSSGTIEFIFPLQNDIRTIILSPNDDDKDQMNMPIMFDSFAKETCDDFWNINVYKAIHVNIPLHHERINETLDNYDKTKEKLLLDTLNITLIVMFLLGIVGFYQIAFSYGLGGLTNILYMLILQHEIDCICDNNKTGLSLFPLRMIIILIIAWCIVFKYEYSIIAFFLGFNSGKIALILDTYNDDR